MSNPKRPPMSGAARMAAMIASMGKPGVRHPIIQRQFEPAVTPEMARKFKATAEQLKLDSLKQAEAKRRRKGWSKRAKP